MFGTVPDMRVGILAVDGMLDLGLACLLDILSTANTLSPQLGLAGAPFETIPLGLGDRVRTAHGLTSPPPARRSRTSTSPCPWSGGAARRWPTSSLATWSWGTARPRARWR